MNKLLASELGFLGINVDSNFDLAWLKTEVANKIREGDQTSIYKLVNFARHSESQEIRDYANIIAKVYEDKVEAYGNIDVTKEEKKEPEYEKKAETAEEVAEAITEAIEAGEDIKVEVTANIDLTSGTLQSISIPEGTNADIKLDKGVTITCTKEGFKVGKDASLVLSGDGTILATTANANSAIKVESGAELTIDGITIDGTTGKEDKLDNWVYGVYAVNSSVVNFKSGTIKVGGASCISTNNLTGGSVINVSGGELLATNGYAIYMPAQGEVNITGGKVQGINARMGTINISGNAEILPTGINDDNCDPLGSNINTSGSIALGDTITVIAGTYTDVSGTDTNINITGNAKVSSNYHAAIGIYAFDTKQASNVTVNVDTSASVSTTDTNFDAYKVYEHEYISDKAIEAGKTYNPIVTSDIKIYVGNGVVYPVATEEAG